MRADGPDSLLDALRGEWSLTRTIPGQGTMAGTARFEPHRPGVLRYREEGVLTLASGLPLRVSREYFYVVEADRVRVAFADGGEPGETLHSLRLAGSWPLEAADVHRCGADTYEGSYRFEGDGRLTITMVVRGPAKDYAIHSTLERLRRDPAGFDDLSRA